MQRQWPTQLATVLASHWTRPSSFTRPDYGADWVREMVRELKPTVDRGCITAADYAIYERASAVVMGLVEGLPTDAWGLIHANLHPNNLVILGTTVCPGDVVVRRLHHALR